MPPNTWRAGSSRLGLLRRANRVPAARHTSSDSRSKSSLPQLEGTSVSLLFEQNGSKRVVPCQLGVDVTFSPWGVAAGEIDAPVVFAGFGQVDPAKQIDDYDGIDVKGRFVLIFTGQRPAQNSSAQEQAKPATPSRRRRGGFSFAGQEKAIERRCARDHLIRAADAEAGPNPNARPPMGLFGFGQPSTTLGRAPSRIPTISVRRTDSRADPEDNRAQARLETEAPRRLSHPLHVRGQERDEGRPQRHRTVPWLESG